MPHHSAQNRQMTSFGGGHSAAGPPPPPPMMTASSSFPPRSSYGDYYHMQVQGGPPPHHPPPPSYSSYHQPPQPPPPPHLMHPSGGHGHPPVSMASSWATSSPSGSVNNYSGGAGGPVIHRVDLQEDLHQQNHSQATQGGSSSSRGGSSSVVDDASSSPHSTPRLLLPNEESRSFDSSTPHEVAAASVLLLAATAMKERSGDGINHHRSFATNNTSARSAGTPTPNTQADDVQEPELKKRKQTAAGIMRKKSNDASMASHVSPYSHSSTNEDEDQDHSHDHRNRNDGARESPPVEATTTPLTDHHPAASGASPTSSYDLKDGQALHDSAKITDPKDISLPPSHVEIPHFPSVLHAVLTESEFAGKVLMWLPHGQAWKIVRWDALRKQVLPKYFAQLNEDNKEASGSIDAFLWHLSSWGFDEVNDGPDVGAYSHVLFRRELPGLCREMRFSPSDNNNETTVDAMITPEKDHRAGEVGGARYILQVPSLASTGGVPSSDHSRNAADEEKKEDYPASTRLSMSSYPNQVTPAWPKRPHVSLGYHPHPYSDPNAMQVPAPGAGGGGQWKYYPDPSQWIGSSSNNTIATSSPTSVTSQRSVPPYSPIRVRSGRGACRLPLNRSRTVPDVGDGGILPAQAPPRSSFPVSNRGKGGKASPRRLSHPSSETSMASHGSGMTMLSTSLTEAATAMTRIRPSILKRKLPLMRKTSSADDASVSTPTHSNEDEHPARNSPSLEGKEEEKKDEEDDGVTQCHYHPQYSRDESSPVATQVTSV